MKRTISLFIACLMGTGALASAFRDEVNSIADVDRLANKLKNEILNCDSQYQTTRGARTYYVAAEGSDQNNGLSENKPFKSLDKVNKMSFQPGDVVLFKRGDLWRGHITTHDGVVYSAYGKGPKPAIYGSPFDAADPSLWEKTDCAGVYRLTKTLSDDVGTLVFNNGGMGCAYKVLLAKDYTGASFHHETREPFFTYRDLHRDLDFYHDLTDGTVYLKSDKGNPGKRFSSIEILTRGHCFTVTKGGATIDSFCVKYTGSHGVGASQGITSLTVTNCEFGWIGGSVQLDNPKPEKPGRLVQATRYGNAIEIWGTCDYYFVDHNYVYQIYDAGLTHQWRAKSPGGVIKDVTYSRNLVEHCAYALEYFLSGDEDIAAQCLMKNILVKDNIFRMSGTYGWGYQRPDKDSPAVIKAWKNNGNRSENFIIENNIIDRGNPHLLDVHAGRQEWMPECRGNIYLQNEGVPIGTEIEKDAKVIISRASVLGKTTVFDENSSANCLWVDGHYLYGGADGIVRIYDIAANPINPVSVSSVELNGLVRQLTVKNGKLFVTARETGCWIYDVSNPIKPVFIQRYDSVELATGIDVAGDCMFVGQRQNGVEFVDISKPGHAEHIDIIKTFESQSVFYKDGYLYSGEWASGEITVFDVHDLSKIKVVRTVKMQGFGDGLWASGNRLYASTGHHHVNHAKKLASGDGHGVEIFDITDPSYPKFISRVEFDTFYQVGTDWWTPRPSGDGRTLFCSDVYNGGYIVDISDEKNPHILEHFESPNKQVVTSVALGNGVVYFSGKDGFMSVPCALASPSTRQDGVMPKNTSFRKEYAPLNNRAFLNWAPEGRGQSHSAEAYGDALFVACGDAGLYIVKMDKKGQAYTFSHPVTTFVGDAKVHKGRLYLAQGEQGVGVYKIHEGLKLEKETMIKQLGNHKSSQVCFWLFIPNDNYLVAGSRHRGYQFMAIEGTDEKPVYKYRHQCSIDVNYNKYVPAHVCAGDIFPYVARWGMVWLDLSSTAKVVQSEKDPDFKSTYLYGVTDFKDGMALRNHDKKFSLMVPGKFEDVETTYEDDAFIGQPRWDGKDRLVLTNFVDRTVSVVNVADFNNPKVEKFVGVSGQPEAGTFWNGKAVAPCGYQGIIIEK